MTFDFVMDAFPAYTYFDQTKKVVCDITIVSGDSEDDSAVKHSDPVDHADVVAPAPEPALSDFVAAVTAKVSDVIGQEKDAALATLQAAADEVGAGAVVAYATEPDGLTGEGTVKVTYKEEESEEIAVDIIAG